MTKLQYKQYRHFNRLSGLPKIMSFAFIAAFGACSAAMETEKIKQEDIEEEVKTKKISNIWFDFIEILGKCWDVDYSLKNDIIKIFIRQLKELNK